MTIYQVGCGKVEPHTARNQRRFIMLENEVNLNGMKGWDKLDDKTKKTANEQAHAVISALRGEAESKLEAGKHLTELRKAIPKNMFLACLRETFHMSRATAYRYMENYASTSKKLPKPILEAAMRRGYKPVLLKMMENNPPPKTEDPVKIRKYLDKIEKTPRPVETEAIKWDSDVLLKEVVNFANSRFEKLPRNTRTRTAWVRSLIGMLMTKFGLGTEQAFDPIAIPEGFRSVRGRPKKAA
jgi:hypothetical protein